MAIFTPFPARIRRLPARSRSFRRDRSGVAAVEFAVILPVMLIFYLGTVEVTQAVRAAAKTSAVAEAVGNLVTRLKEVDDTSLGNIFAISSAIMNPYPVADLKLDVTAVRIDANGRGTVHWSKASRGTAPAAGSTYPVPTGLQAFPGSYFVVARATYDYKPTLRYTGSVGNFTFERSQTFRPRKTVEITLK